MTLEQFYETRGMLREGRRHVAIARELDLSLWTVARIASEPQFQGDDLIETDLPEDDGPADYAARELRRCGGCGAMVYRWPCLACQMVELPRVADAMEEEDEDKEEDELFELLEEAATNGF